MNITKAQTQEFTRLMLHVVLPVGTGTWAFTQTINATSEPVFVGLMLTVVVSFAYGFNRLIKIIDERLNRRYNEAIDPSEL